LSGNVDAGTAAHGFHLLANPRDWKPEGLTIHLSVPIEQLAE
jgi:hypothetical protein